MSYHEKVLTAQIQSATARGLLNVSQPISGTLNASGQIAGSSIHYATTAEWNSKPDFIGKKGHIYVYSDYTSTEINGESVLVPNIKIGDGKAYLIDSPFVTTSIEDIINTHINDTVIHISSDDRKTWDSKISCRINPNDPENIIFEGIS